MTNSAVNILIVDDEPPIRKLLRVGLSTQDYTVSEAMNAKVAMELVEQDKPDLVILDLGLPDMSGHDLLAKWRSEGWRCRSSSCPAEPMKQVSSRHSNWEPTTTLQSPSA